MRAVTDWDDVPKHAMPLVVIDAEVLIEDYGQGAHREAVERQHGRRPTLGRSADHWRDVAEEVARHHEHFGIPHYPH
jgi:hypothetical protein